MGVRYKLFSAVSWRVEARAAALPAEAGQRLRERLGHLMRWTGVHGSLPQVRNRAVILCFHGIGERPDPQVESGVLEVRKFCQLLGVLERSFQVISLAELVAALRESNPLPPRSVAITFDDGYANNYELAAGELAARRMPWSAFLPVLLVENGARQWVDDVRVLLHRGRHQRLTFNWGGQEVELDLTTPDQRRAAVASLEQRYRYAPEETRQNRLNELYAQYSLDEIQSLRARYPSFAVMSWPQARELKQAGVDVGSHGLTHIALAPQSPERIRHEIAAARDLLQQRIGDHSPHFSYPYGRTVSISPTTQGVLEEAGYQCALTLEADVVHCPGADPMQLPRLIVSSRVGRVLVGLWQRFNVCAGDAAR